MPKKLPINAVKPIAIAPQNIIRKAGFITGAPLMLAARAPKAPRSIMQSPEEAATKISRGKSKIASTGNKAPNENDAADANAACNGLAVVSSDIPNSSRA